MNNFDIVRYEYYRDRDVAFEGFTGKSYLFREEFTSRIWATRYDFPAIKDGRVKRDVLPDETPSGAQGWFINTRREKFKDKRLREALIYAFDFEWTNKTIMYGSYERTHSVFQNSDMMAHGQAGRARNWRCSSRSAARCPTRCSASRSCRRCPTARARTARCCARRAQLLQEAGYVDQGRQARDAAGRADQHRVPARRAVVPAAPHAVHQESRHARHRRHLRMVDPVQYRKRVDDFDFDMTSSASVSRARRAIRCAAYFSSQAAALKGSQNLAGIADPAIDALIDTIIAADDRPSWSPPAGRSTG